MLIFLNPDSTSGISECLRVCLHPHPATCNVAVKLMVFQMVVGRVEFIPAKSWTHIKWSISADY